MWFVISCYVFLLIQFTEAVVKLQPNVTVPAIIAFGDSIVDQGTNNYLPTIAKCDFPPYGQDFVSGLATGRFTNGMSPLDLIAQELGIKDYVPAYLNPNLQSTDLLTGVSFASGGSGYDPQTPLESLVLSLPHQLEMFKEYINKLKAIVGEEHTNYIVGNSLYIVVAGRVDFASTYFILGARRIHYDVPSYADLLIDYATNFIQGLYDLGARRMGVFGVPPVGCVPSQRTLAGGLNRVCVDSYNRASQVYNSKLSTRLHTFGNTLPNSKLVYIDIYTMLFDVIHDPKKYGLDVVDRGYCGTGKLEVILLCNKLTPTCPDHSKYLFWDSYHPTEIGYKILVNQVLGKYMNSFF